MAILYWYRNKKLRELTLRFHLEGFVTMSKFKHKIIWMQNNIIKLQLFAVASVDVP